MFKYWSATSRKEPPRIPQATQPPAQSPCTLRVKAACLRLTTRSSGRHLLLIERVIRESSGYFAATISRSGRSCTAHFCHKHEQVIAKRSRTRRELARSRDSTKGDLSDEF